AASERVVPGVVGRPQVEAARRVTKAGLVPKIVPRDSAKPPGDVVAQKPGGGAQLKAGSPVKLFVSRGKGSVAVPNVVGIPVAQATAHLAAAGLTANRKPVSSSKPAGTVVAQDPAAGSSTPRGSSVTLNVSSGPQ